MPTPNLPLYSVTVHWSNEDDAYLAEVPELPGCLSDGRTRAEAVTNLEDAIVAWIQTATKLGFEIPEPRLLS